MLRSQTNIRLLGTIDAAAEFYIVYSTSNVPYQDWQTEFLEYTINSSPDASRCQIIRLVSNDTRAEHNTYQLGSGATFIFPSHTDLLPDGTYYALLNKPRAFQSLTAWWMSNPDLDPDAVFVLVDPDMAWHAPLAHTDVPTKGLIHGHLWTADGHVMFPLVIRASDLQLMSAAYERHTIALYERYDYHAEMYGFTKAAQESGLRQHGDPAFGPTAGYSTLDHYSAARFLHYCQDFRVRDQSKWFKQDYTPSTARRPWKRPPASQVVEDEGQRFVIDRLHDLITYQTRSAVRPRRIDVDPDGTLLDVYLWAISDDEAWIRENCRWSLETARKCGLRPRLAGIAYDTRHLAHCQHGVDLARFYVLRELLSRVSDTRLLLLMDGFDTLFRGTEEQIVTAFLAYNTQILISAEKAYTYQWMELRHKYDAIPSPYRYVGCGTIMGFAGALKQMTEEGIYNIEHGFSHGNDQGLIGKYVYDHFDDAAHVRLDTQCRLFWVTTDDTQVFSESPFCNPHTQTRPLISHVIGGGRENAALYARVGHSIMLLGDRGGPASAQVGRSKPGASAGEMVKKVKFVVGIEDRVSLRWQLAILLESLRGKLPDGWEPWVVVCNDDRPLSTDLQRLLNAYGTRHFTGANHPHRENMDFVTGGDVYVPINRIEALNVVADHVGDDDLVCLTETDVFLYKDLNPRVFPSGNALFDNWIVRQDVFFTHGGAHEKTGVRLRLLLEAMGCTTPFKPGGVTIFLDAATLRRKKIIQDAFRFTQVLYLLGTIVEVPKIWIAEMPAVALALTANGVDYQLLTAPEFTTQNQDHETIPHGTFYHYYHDLRDGGDGAFRGTRWYKHQFTFENFLTRDLGPYAANAVTDHEKYFFDVARRAQSRVWRFNPPQAIEKRTIELRARVHDYGLGFRKTTLDPTLFDLLKRRLASHRLEEERGDVSDYIKNVVPGAPVTRFQPDDEFNRALLVALRPLHEEWCGFPLAESACYGIRVYLHGTYLYEHTDTPDTHIISSTICVDRNIDEPWPLCIEDGAGGRHHVLLEPGEMLLYEGARLRHGRPYPLCGASYAGIYLHYRPAAEPPR